MSWKRIYEVFDPLEPATRPQDRAPRPGSPTDSLLAALRRPFGLQKVVLMGSVGTGKTSELHRLLDAQAGLRRGVYVSLSDYFEQQGDAAAIARVLPWEVVALVGASALSAAERYTILDRGERAAFAAALKPLLPAEAAPVEGLIAAVGAVISLVSPGVGQVVQALGSTATWATKLGRGGAGLPGDDPRVRALLDATNRALLALGRVDAPPLLLLDGFDRLEPFGPETWEPHFVRSDLLASFECHTVVTAPLALRRTQRALALRGLAPMVITEVPVATHGDPRRPNEPGVAFFRTLWHQRAGADAPKIPDPLINRLGYFSSGRVRAFVQMVRDLCFIADADVATESDVEEVLRNYRVNRVEAWFTQGMITALREVLATGLLPDDPIVDRLVQTGIVVAYPNNEEWYCPHPILFMGHLSG